MDDVVEVSGLENACRLCLTTEQTRSSIFGVPHVSVPFAEKIRVCLSIHVSSSDTLSTLVCTSCIKNINHWHSYKDNCLRSQEKLQQWLLSKEKSMLLPVVTVKDEPMDVSMPNDNVQDTTKESNINHAVQNGMDANSETIAIPSTNKMPQLSDLVQPQDISDTGNDIIPAVQIKSEPVDTEDEDDCNIDVESINSGELLINPMAVAANAVNADRMEADSTQKFSRRRYVAKKKFRRGPHTHFRAPKLFKKKCLHCKINLHSKHSYTQHMSRYHGIIDSSESIEIPKLVNQPLLNKQKSKLIEHPDNAESAADTQNKSNPEDAEFEQMIKTEPLTPVQKNIIGQLKTFSCYSCKQTFFDRRHTLNHIRQHMPDLRPYTCIACLTEFSDRSMYKLHCGASFECAMKIALVVPKIGNEKYFTCNMCLRPFANRQGLLTHLAMHADKQYQQLEQPLSSPSMLKSTTPVPSTPRVESSPSKRTYSNQAGPYMNGDPAHNHICDLCGMIYRYKPNMFKHRELCATLADNVRTSYRCIHCNMTYLVYKKFYSHVFTDHKKHEITCFTCHGKFSTADDYLVHHETHRVLPKERENVNEIVNEQHQQPGNNYSILNDDTSTSEDPLEASEKPFNCALCSEKFTTKLELTEHRNLHLKVKIYSCVICRSMFSSSGALEVHMKEHGIDDAVEQNANSSCIEYNSRNSMNDTSMSATSDPGGKFHHCYLCNKNFSNYANLKRHENNLHVKQLKRRWSCDVCKRRFKSAQDHDEHLLNAHGMTSQQQRRPIPPSLVPTPTQISTQTQFSTTTGKPLMHCPKCPKTFTYQGNLILHCQNVHQDYNFQLSSLRQSAPPAPRRALPVITARGYACDICGKTFREEQSLKTHRGWHLRSNYRLKVDQNASLNEKTMSTPGYTVTSGTPKPAKARKSFPNNPSQKQLNAITSLQCQVCDDRFADVEILRKHLWDVHCARNKPEKTFTTDLQCELCTNKFPDEEALENHMKWHSQNPILSGSMNKKVAVPEVSKKSFCCDVCGKYYSNRKLFLRHKKLHKVLPAGTMMNLHSLQTKRHYCHACQKSFSTDASLRRHKASPCHQSNTRSHLQVSKKITTTALVHHPPPDPATEVKNEPDIMPDYPDGIPTTGAHGQLLKKRPVTCHICKLIFPNMSILYQHKQLAHKPGGSNKISPTKAKDCVPLVNNEGLVSCNLCGKQFPGVSNLKQHFAHKHKTKGSSFPCYAQGCKLVFSSLSSLKNHETTHSSMIFNCQLCDRHVFSRAAMTKHMLTMHKAIYQSGANKNTLWSETDLTSYNIKNCQSTACPKCKVKYPNLRALKIHYIKFHDKS